WLARSQNRRRSQTNTNRDRYALRGRGTTNVRNADRSVKSTSIAPTAKTSTSTATMTGRAYPRERRAPTGEESIGGAVLGVAAGVAPAEDPDVALARGGALEF